MTDTINPTPHESNSNRPDWLDAWFHEQDDNYFAHRSRGFEAIEGFRTGVSSPQEEKVIKNAIAVYEAADQQHIEMLGEVTFANDEERLADEIGREQRLIERVGTDLVVLDKEAANQPPITQGNGEQ
ncbi:MAG: hypothetical protein ABIQ89_00100 [Candidatus Saccharimonadales bacterium]